MTNEELRKAAVHAQTQAAFFTKRSEELAVVIIAIIQHYGGKVGITQAEVDKIGKGHSFTLARDAVTNDISLTVNEPAKVESNGRFGH